MEELPEGFVLDTQADTAPTSGVPEGFVLDNTTEDTMPIEAPVAPVGQGNMQEQPIDPQVDMSTKQAPTPSLYPNAEDVPSTYERVKDELAFGIEGAMNGFAKIQKMTGEAIIGGTELIQPALEMVGQGQFGKDIQSKVKDTIDLYSGFWGNEVAKNKATHIAKYGKDKWDVGTTLGETVPDVLAGLATAPTKVATGLSELALSSARNEVFSSTEVPLTEKLKSVSVDVGAAVIGMSIINKILPDSQKAELKQVVDYIVDPEDKRIVQEGLQAIEEAGIESLDYKSRETLLKKVVGGEINSNKDVSRAIKAEVETARKTILDKRDKAYTEANKIGVTTDLIKPKVIVKNIRESINTDKEFKLFFDGEKPDKILKEFRKKINKDDNLNAADLERHIKDLNTNMLYDGGVEDKARKKIIEFIQEEQDKLLIKANKPMVYKEARALHSEYVNKFTKNAEGIDSKSAERFQQIVNDPNLYDTAKDLFGKNIDTNIASSFVKNVKGSKEVRRKAVGSILMDKIDLDDLYSQGGVAQVMTNFQKINPEALKILIGKEEAKALRGRIKGLQLVTDAIAQTEASMNGSIKKDLGNLVAGSLMTKFAPIVGLRSVLSSSKAITEKLVSIKTDRSRVMKWISEQPQTPEIKRLAKGIMFMNIASEPMNKEEKE